MESGGGGGGGILAASESLLQHASGPLLWPRAIVAGKRRETSTSTSTGSTSGNGGDGGDGLSAAFPRTVVYVAEYLGRVWELGCDEGSRHKRLLVDVQHTGDEEQQQQEERTGGGGSRGGGSASELVRSFLEANQRASDTGTSTARADRRTTASASFLRLAM